MSTFIKIMYCFLIIGVLLAGFIACDSGDGEYTSQFTSTPDAIAAYNNSSGGVYKGVL